MDLQSHIDEHLKKDNNYIKSIYGEGINGHGNLPDYLQLRLVNSDLGKVVAPQSNVVHMYQGSVDQFIITDGLVYFDGVSISKLTAKNSRIRISDTVEGKQSKILDLILENCELDVWRSEFRGYRMFISVKNSRVNIFDCNIQCNVGGLIEDSNFNVMRNEITIASEGWTLKNTDLRYTNVVIKASNSLPLHKVESSYIELSNVEIFNENNQFIGSNYSVCANDSTFRNGNTAFDISGSGYLKLDNCKCYDMQTCIKLDGTAVSCHWCGGYGRSKNTAINLNNKASAILFDLEEIKGEQTGISANNHSTVYADSISNIEGSQSSCEAKEFSSMELLNCNFKSGGVAFKGTEGTFIIRGDNTSIQAGTTAEGSGTFVIDDEDETFF